MQWEECSETYRVLKLLIYLVDDRQWLWQLRLNASLIPSTKGWQYLGTGRERGGIDGRRKLNYTGLQQDAYTLHTYIHNGTESYHILIWNVVHLLDQWVLQSVTWAVTLFPCPWQTASAWTGSGGCGQWGPCQTQPQRIWAPLPDYQAQQVTGQSLQ